MKKTVITITVIVFAVIAAFVWPGFLTISTKDSAVDQEKYLGNRVNSAGIYSSPSNGLFYSPVNLAVNPMDKLMLIDIDDDPEYTTIELQTFNDERGRGARVILYHHQGPADSYYTDEAFVLKESDHDRFFIAPDMTYNFNVTTSGLEASLKMRDHKGKPVEFRVRETSRKKWSKGFLAPIGVSSAITFEYFPFFHMKDMNFVLRSGTEISIKIGGKERKAKKLPLPVDRELVYLSRYTAFPVIGCWNRPHDGALKPFKPGQQMAYRDGRTLYELVNNSGHYEIRRITAFNSSHKASLDFSPAIPDLPCLKDGLEIKGRFSAGADGITGIVAGEYSVIRRGNIITMEIRPLEAWQPIPGTIWVRNWTWNGTISAGTNSNLSMKSGWNRKK